MDDDYVKLLGKKRQRERTGSVRTWSEDEILVAVDLPHFFVFPPVDQEEGLNCQDVVSVEK